MKNRKWEYFTFEEQKELAKEMNIETRVCNKCNQEKFVTVSFTNKSSPNTCKECISKKEIERRHKRNAINPDRHWKKTNFGRVL